MTRPRISLCSAAVFLVTFILGAGEIARAQELTATNTSLAFGKDASLRASRRFAANSATTLITAPFPVFWEEPATGSLYATVGVPPRIRPGQLLQGSDLASYSAPSVQYEAPNHPYIIQELDQGGVEAINARVGSRSGEQVSTRVEYGRMRVGIVIDPRMGGNQVRLGNFTNFIVTVAAGFGPVRQLRIDFGTEVEAEGPGLTRGTARVFTASNPGNPLPLIVTYPPDFGSSTVSIKVVATTGSFTQESPNQADGSGLTSDGAVISGILTVPTIKAGTRRPGSGSAGNATSSSGALHFGKEQSVRASTTLSLTDPSLTTVSAPGPALWELPKVGSLYAAVPVPGISVGQLLFSGNIATYNAGTPASVLFEAGNHPYIIQSMPQGGQTNVNGTLAGGEEKFTIQLPWGRDRIKVEVDSDNNGKITLGVPTTFRFTLPSTFTGATFLRVDFGTDVLGPGGVVGRVFTVAPMPITVTYPPTYTSQTILVKAVATTLIFLEPAPNQVDGSGLQANGATVSGVGSFPVVKSPPGSMTVVMVANRPRARSGQAVVLRTVVTNTSSFPLSNVRASARQLGELDGAATLAPGASVTSVRELRPTDTIRSSATATARDPFGNTVSGSSDEVVVEVIRPEIALKVVAAPSRTKFGREVVFTYSVSNTGDGNLTGVDLGDGGRVGTLTPGQTRTATVRRTYPVGTASPVVFEGRASGTPEDDPGGGPVNATDEEEVELIETSMTVTIVADKPKVTAGGKVNYTVTVTNTGGGEIRNIVVTIDGVGTLGPILSLPPGESRDLTREETPTVSGPRIARAGGVDDWDPIAAQGTVDVQVMHPSLQVTVTGNGSANTVKAEKGKPVRFEVRVKNSGDCDLTNVSVNYGGPKVINDLKPGETIGPLVDSQSYDQDDTYSVTVTGKDPEGNNVSQKNSVRIEVQSNVILEGIKKMAGDATRLLDELDQLVVKMKAAHQDFDGRVGIVQGMGLKLCDDPEALVFLQTGGSIHARAKVVVKEINDIVARLQAMPGTKATVGAGAASNVDLLDVLSRIPGVLSDRMPAIQKHWDEMQAAWKAAGCGKAPGAKGNLVTISGRVVDKSGAPVKDAQVTCGGKSFQGSNFTLVLPLNRGDFVDATASATIPGAQFVVADAASVPWDGTSDPMPVVVVLDLSAKRTVTIKGIVTDKNGQPLPNAIITSTIGATGNSGAGGEYSLSGDAEIGKPITVTATVTTKSKDKPTGAGTAPYKGEAELNLPIRIAGAEMPQEFSIAGTVHDAKGAPIQAAITAGSQTSDSKGGTYTIGPFTGQVGTEIDVTASFTDTKGVKHAKTVKSVYQGGGAAGAPPITFDLAKLVTFTIVGKVVDSKGTGLVGAQVTATGGTPVQSAGPVTTGAGGAFSGLGPFQVQADEAITVSASVTMLTGDPATGGSKVTSKFDGDVATTIVIAKAVTKEKFVVSGMVVDSKGRPMRGVAVEIPGKWSGATGEGGVFTSKEFEEDVGTSLPVKATVTLKDKSTRGAEGAAVYSGGKTADAGVLKIGEATMEPPVTVTGRVVDKNDKPIPSADVTVSTRKPDGSAGSGWRGATDGGGDFRTDPPLVVDLGSSVSVSASIKGTDGKAHSAGAASSYQGETVIDVGSIKIADIEMKAPNKRVASLSVSPGGAKVKVGDKVIRFTATATYEDNTTGDVTSETMWEGGEGNGSFIPTSVGSFPVAGTYGGVKDIATVQVSEPDLGDIIDDILKGGDATKCSADNLKQKFTELQRSVAGLREIKQRFEGGSSLFRQELNNQKARPCNNGQLARAFSVSTRNLTIYQSQSAATRALAREVIAMKARCPDLLLAPAIGGGYDAEGLLREIGSSEADMERRVKEMNEQLRANGCDSTDVRRTGDQIASTTKDPLAPGNVEICGNNVDDDGDGLTDEDCAGVLGSNVIITLFDSGNAKDDSFQLSVSSKGPLGTTAPGALASFGVPLSPGTYTATVTVVLAPDNFGSYTITIQEGKRVIATAGCSTTCPGQGASVPLSFTVGAPNPPSLPPVNFNRITVDEVAEVAKRTARKGKK